MKTFDELEKTTQRKDKISVQCIKIPLHPDPPLRERAINKFEVSQEYNAEYLIDSKLKGGWIIEGVPLKKYEVREHFSVVE